jgi:aspartate/methionine/tyrosine aminotransferase
MTSHHANISPASTLARIQPSRIRQLADIAFGMEGVFRLHFGESNMPTPRYINDAAAQALANGYTFYTENAGLPSLRAAIARKIAELHGVDLDPASEILITASGTQALNVTIRCTIDPGDEVLILTPNWPNAGEIVKLYGATPVEVGFAQQNGQYTIDFAALEAAVTERTRLLVYTSPSNPLGWMATQEDQAALLAFCRKHGLWLLADEVYERIYFKGPVAPSILRLATCNDAVIVVQSFSKSYCMTGWRLGWAVSRRDLIRQATPLNEFIISHAPSFIQKAGEAALAHGEDEIAARSELFHERMAYCYNALTSVKGVSLAKPAGAFYLFPRIAGVEDSFAFAHDLLLATKVSVAPGIAFGRAGEGAIRICTASDFSVLEPAMERLCRFVQRG